MIIHLLIYFYFAIQLLIKFDPFIYQSMRPTAVIQKMEKLLTSNTQKKSLLELKNKSKSPLPFKNTTVSPRLYRENSREINYIESHKRQIIYDLHEHLNFKVQNPHSQFLNSKNQKKPLYERVEDILKERQGLLALKREKKTQAELIKKEAEEQEFFEMNSSKKMNKKDAKLLSEKLYKESQARLKRLNQKRIEFFKEDAKYFRGKPEVGQTSQLIFQKMKEQNIYESDVLKRFEQYDKKQSENKKQFEKQIKKIYYPHTPRISENTRQINSERSPKKLEKNKHCLSCMLKSDEKTFEQSPKQKKRKNEPESAFEMNRTLSYQ